LEALASVVFSLALGRIEFTWFLLFGCIIMTVACVSASLSESKEEKPCE
jgi:hypothetical protein